MEKRPVAYQLFSVREDAEQDFEGVLKALAGMGYDGVELAGFYGHTPQELRGMLDRCGLKAISSHVPLARIEADMYGVLSEHITLGCQYIAVPYMDEETRAGSAGFPHALKIMDRFARLSKEAGIQLLYHNHDFELKKFSGMHALDFLYELFPEDLLKAEIDVCWVKFAGLNPAAYLKKYAGRCPLVHLKDYVGTQRGETEGHGESTGEKFEFRPFGYGCQQAEDVVCAGIDAGASWFVVEQDESPTCTPLEAAKMSMETLKKIGLK